MSEPDDTLRCKSCGKDADAYLTVSPTIVRYYGQGIVIPEPDDFCSWRCLASYADTKAASE